MQLYVSQRDSDIERVAKEMKGFGRVDLEPGESVDLEIAIDDESLCYFDPTSGWTLETCGYDFRVGFSAAELILESSWDFDGEDWTPV